jgi:hypothetical protein
MLIKKQKEKIFEFAEKAHTSSHNLTLTTEDLTPVNYREEEEKFFRLDNYNPQFKYRIRSFPDMKMPLSELEESLLGMEIPSDIKLFLHKYIEDMRTRMRVKQAIGTKDFPIEVENLFDWELVPLSVLDKSLPEVIFHEEAHPLLYNAYEMQDIFSKYLQESGITFCNVQVDSFNDHMIRVGDKQLTIGKAIKRNSNNVRRLIVHEIESHIFQRHNIKKGKNPFVYIQRFPDWLLYSEGLAVYNEVRTKTITKSAYLNYRLRYKAVTMRHKSFRQIYEEMLSEVSQEKAFLLAYRVKRGMGDTRLPGGYPKDAAYLLGLKRIYTYLKDGGSYPLLYRSRIPKLGEVMEKYDLLKESPHLLPQAKNYHTVIESLHA